MPAASPVSLREVPWALRRITSTSGLLSLLEQIKHWLDAVPYPSPSGVSGGRCDTEPTGKAVKKFLSDPSTYDASARKQFVAQMSSKRKQNPAIWTKEVAASFREVLATLDRLAAEQASKQDLDDNRVPNADINVEDISFEGCDPMFVDHYREFYSRDRQTVLTAVSNALTSLKAGKENRPKTIAGNGADHVLHVVNLRAGPDLLLQSVRLLAEAALHDSTEATFFDQGAVEAAMRIGRECKDLEIRCHAARLFFNLAFLKKNRLSFIRKGGLHHTSYLARTTMGDTSSGNAQKLILFAAKTMYQLSCAEECSKRVFFYSGFQELWLTFARHPTQDVRQRAAGVFNKVVAMDLGTKRAHASWCRFMVEEVTQGIMSNDSNSNATQAQKKARSIASANGWRIRGDGVA